MLYKGGKTETKTIAIASLKIPHTGDTKSLDVCG